MVCAGESSVNTMMKKFALEAGGSHYPSVNTQQLERFYQLVVQECAQLVTTHMDPGLVLEHFGIDHERTDKRACTTSRNDSIER